MTAVVIKAPDLRRLSAFAGRNLGGPVKLLLPLLGILLLTACGNSSPTGSTRRPGTGTAAAPQPSTPASATGTSTGSQSPPESGPVLPAVFKIQAGGRLDPPTVSGPNGVAVRLTLASGDGRPHRVVVGTTPPRTLEVPAGKSAVTVVKGLRAGHYPIEVDGARRGTLVIGVQPGP